MERRDREIYQRWEAGEKLRSLADEYGLSVERVRQICKRQAAIEDRGEPSDLYRLLLYRFSFTMPSGRASCAPRFAYRYVTQRWSMADHEGEPTVEFFLSIPEDEIRNARNVGPQTAEYMLSVQAALRGERSPSRAGV